jgi:hypothetical protein
MVVAVWPADYARGRVDLDVGTDEHSVGAEDRVDELARQPEVDLPDRVRLAQPAVATREVEIDLAAIFRSSRAPIDLDAAANSAVTSPHTTARR